MNAYGPLLDVLADAVVASDTGNRVIYANPAAEKLFGWTRAELIGQRLTVLMPERMRALHEAGFRHYVETGHGRILGRPVRVPARRADGVEFDVELTLSTLPGGGEGTIILASIRDLRDRVELERQIAIQKRLAAQNAVMSAFVAAQSVEAVAAGALRAIGENLNWDVGNFWLQAEGGLRSIASWHAAGVAAGPFVEQSRVLALREGEGLPGRVWLDHRPAWIEDVTLDKNFPRHEAARQAGLRGAFAFPIPVADAVFAVLEFFRCTPQVIDGDLLVSVAALGAQVGQCVERIHAEQRQRAATLSAERAERRALFLAEASATLGSDLDYGQTLRRVAELAVPVIADWCTVSAVDERGVLQRMAVVHRDPAKLALVREYETHFPPADHRAGSLLQALGGGAAILQRAVTDADLAAAAQTPEHLRILRGLGCTSCVMVPMAIRGEGVGVISFMKADGSAPFDDGDARLAQDLAHRAAAAIENARLYRQAQEAVKLRENFLAIASHELRTPLTSLQLQVGLLARVLRPDDPAPPEQLRAKIATVDRQVRRLSTLVDHLLDVSRASAGGLRLEPEPVDLAALVREVAATFEDDLGAVGSRLTLVLQEGVVGSWDRLRLAQVVSNLISNAVKYGAGAPIEIGARAQGSTAVVTVRDGGIGIAPDDQRRIFERFERAVPAGHYMGLGLGLWVVRAFVEAMGGRVSVESASGKGSTFSVELPVTHGNPSPA